MTLTQLLPLADGWETLAQVRDALRRGRRSAQLEGLPVAAKGWMLARLLQEMTPEGGAPPTLLVLTYTEEQAERLAADLREFLLRRRREDGARSAVVPAASARR